jgi:hypothetical protein
MSLIAARAVLVLMSVSATGSTALAQSPRQQAKKQQQILTPSCNPAIDGTYCATQMPTNSGMDTAPGSGLQPLGPIGGGFVSQPGYSSPPGTLGGFSIGGDDNDCIGFLRRSACK